MLPMESWRAEFDERYPIYQQIIHRFSRSLVKGELQQGDRIPSIRELAVTLKVNANTIQRAYQEMERDEMIYSKRGTGYFVMENEQIVDRVRNKMVNESMSRFLQEMRALGFNNGEILSELEHCLQEGGGMDDIADSQGA